MKAIMPIEVDLSDGIKVETTPNTTKRALETAQSFTGTCDGPLIYNQRAVNDDSAPAGDARTMGRYQQFNVGGPNSSGGKYADFVTLRKWLASVSAGDAIARVSQTVSDVADGGPGELYGSNEICYALAGCVTEGVNGDEIDVKIMAGAMVRRRFGHRVVNEGDSKAIGQDAAYGVLSTCGGGGFKTGWLLSNHFGQAPIQPDGEVFGIDGPQQVAHVLNYPALIVTGYIVNLPNFKVTGNGTVTLSGPVPEIVLYENDGPAATKYWDTYVQNGAFKVDALNDQFGNRTNRLTLPPTKPTIAGSRAGASPIVLSLVAALAALGLATDGTTA